MKNIKKYLWLCGAFLCSMWVNAQTLQVSKQAPWSVRMAESEMIRFPEAWQLDYMKRLKWDYCHGVELQAFLNLYDAYGDKKYYDYTLKYCETMVHPDGSIETSSFNGTFLILIIHAEKIPKPKNRKKPMAITS